MAKKKRKPAVRAARKVQKSTAIPWKTLAITTVLLLFALIYYGYIIKSSTAVWRWLKDLNSRPHYHSYKSFNVTLHEDYQICGIDVSSYQGRISWPLVKQMHEGPVHITFAFIKATSGLITTDLYYQHNWHDAQKAGIVCGAYHYFRPKLSGKLQARFFLQNVKLNKGDMPPVVDVETLDNVSPQQMRAELNAFLEYVFQQTKIQPVIYSGLTFYTRYLDGFYSNQTVWLAHYYMPQLVVSKNINWKFWQHSDRARVNGINHAVDFDVFKGDSLGFRGMLIH